MSRAIAAARWEQADRIRGRRKYDTTTASVAALIERRPEVAGVGISLRVELEVSSV